jgi:hypothetical protein
LTFFLSRQLTCVDFCAVANISKGHVESRKEAACRSDSKGCNTAAARFWSGFGEPRKIDGLLSPCKRAGLSGVSIQGLFSAGKKILGNNNEK